MAWKFEHSGCRKKRDIDNRISKKRLEKKDFNLCNNKSEYLYFPCQHKTLKIYPMQ